jgi:nicotinamidase-related amidase
MRYRLKKCKLFGSFFMMFLAVSIFFIGISYNLYSDENPDIIKNWNTIKSPPAPELKTVKTDPKTSALLLLDFNKQTCNSEKRPRCISSIPKVKKILKEARAKGVTVIYSLSPGAAASDISKELFPLKGDPIVTSGPDKFLGTDLEKILRDKNIQTVIVTGTAAHGAVIYTASGAALRGLNVIVPVDGISAESLYPEQYTIWHLVNAPRVSAKMTLTRLDTLKFGTE